MDVLQSSKYSNTGQYLLPESCQNDRCLWKENPQTISGSTQADGVQKIKCEEIYKL
jgi:hypothetical protein